ncbi:MAG: succinylglutamate desuccinylase/aspartoacylase family protein [bacterium]|nr:succinylglutamate desuccinylase/aspartoacylase family protein [bacterium]
MEHAQISETPADTTRNHLVGSFCGDASGPTLIAVGSIHGNEPGGSKALRRLALKLHDLESKLHGRVFLIEGSIRALADKVRFVDSDLNRHWTRENVTALDLGGQGSRAEDWELKELLSVLREILDSARNEVFALDLHSTSALGLPFATVGDTLRNRRFAQKFPVTILLGIEEQLEGTMLEYLNNRGVVTFGFEGGQHDQPETAANHEALLWLSLVHAGIAAEADIPDLDGHRHHLAKASGRARIVEVLFRKPVSDDDKFVMDPGYKNFDLVGKGQTLARDRHGNIQSPRKGLILMPLYQGKGDDGFFIGREVAPFWLWLSKLLRKLGAPTLVRILPGVWRHPDDSESLVIDTRVARFFPLQILHLLGFRRRAWKGKRLVVSRRRFDTRSPFV